MGRVRGQRPAPNACDTAEVVLPNSEGEERGRGRGCGGKGASEKATVVHQQRDMGTPPDWFRPQISVEALHTPRPIKQGVSVNLLFRMQDDRHGLRRLEGDDIEGDNVNMDEDANPVLLDCKETPGSGCDSADRL